jgi:DNA-binding NtrC family response regulator
VARGRLIQPADLTPATKGQPTVKDTLESGSTLSLKDILAETERRVILHALEQAGWNRTKTANLLGISRRQLFDKIQQYNLHQ